MKRPFLFCPFCGKKMDKRRGHWVAMNPKGAIPGTRILRLLTPTALWRSEAQTGIRDQRDTFPIERFKTEARAIPSGEVRQFFDYEKVLACCEHYTCYSTETLPQYYPGKRTIITIDGGANVDGGGQSFTVLTVWDPIHSRLRLVAAKRFQGAAYDNIETLRNELVMICRRFPPPVIAVDHAMGDALTKDLSRILNTKVVRIHYTGNTASLRWSRTNKFYTVNKTEAMEALLLAIERKIFEFPQDETFRDFLLEFTHVAVDHNHNRTRRLMVRKGGPDDFVQCAAYALLMWQHINRSRYGVFS